MSKTWNTGSRKWLQLILMTMAILLSASCNHHRNHPGYAYMGDYDMYYSKAGDAYAPSTALPGGTAMQMPPAGSIPRGEMPYPYLGKSMDEQIRAGKELLNTVVASPDVIQEGKALYQIYCMVCHGETGDGNGFLYTSKRFQAKPTSLIDTYVKSKPDGELYHVITRGSVAGLMGPLASQLRPDHRWKIVHYVRTLQNQ